MEEEIKENQCEATNSSSDHERTQEVSLKRKEAQRFIHSCYFTFFICCFPQAAGQQSFSSLLPKALSAVLHPGGTPGPNADPQLGGDPERNASPNLERLQTELRDLRDQLQQMKSQHKYVCHLALICCSQHHFLLRYPLFPPAGWINCS